VDAVVDASVAFKWLVTEDDSDTALALLRDGNIVVPDLLLIECRNAALTNVRRGGLSAEQARQVEHRLDALPLRTVPTQPLLPRAFEIGLALDHPIYDCIYMAAALATNRMLITADERFFAKVTTRPSDRGHIKLLKAFTAGH
jgi:predicted nucleic acid-binding protein